MCCWRIKTRLPGLTNLTAITTLKFVLNKMTNFKNKKYYWFLSLPIFLVLLYFSDLSYFFSGMILLSFVFLFILFLKIEWGVYLLALSIPLIGVNFRVSFLELPLSDLIALFILIAFVLREVYAYFFYPNTKVKIIKPAVGLFLLFFFITLLSSLLSDNVIGYSWYVFRWVLFFYLAFVLAPVNIIKNKKVLKRTIIFFSLSAILTAIFGFYSLYLQDWHDSFFRLKPIPVFGYWVFGDNYNLLSEVLLCAGFVILSVKYWIKSPQTSKLVNLLSTFLLFGAFLTFGRTVWITIVLQLALYFFIYFIVIKEKKVKIRAIAITLLLFLIVSSPLIFKMISLQEANVSSTQNRMILTEIAYKAFKNKPALGHGSGSFVDLVASSIRFTSKYGAPLDSHGVWQKILAENGALGVLSFAFFSLFIFRKLYLGLINNKKDYKLLLPLFIASVGIFFYQFFNTSYYKGRVWLPIALSLVALILVERQKEANHKNV